MSPVRSRCSGGISTFPARPSPGPRPRSGCSPGWPIRASCLTCAPLLPAAEAEALTEEATELANVGMSGTRLQPVWHAAVRTNSVDSSMSRRSEGQLRQVSLSYAIPAASSRPRMTAACTASPVLRNWCTTCPAGPPGTGGWNPSGWCMV